MQSKVKDYLEIVEKVARIEQRRIPNHMVEHEELVSIGIIAVQALIKNKSKEDLKKYNKSYIGTAVRWAIRNELRNRYKWYSYKQGQKTGEGEEGADGVDASPQALREGIYEAVLSIDSISESSDSDTPFDFLKDGAALPEERLELVELSKAIKRAIACLPPKERTIVEYRFYRNLQIKEIATQVGLSSSRITRIVQSALNNIREYLISNDHI